MSSGKQTRELHELREEARALLNSIEDYAIFLLSADGTVLTWNAGARRYNGYQEDEIVGQSFEVFYAEADRTAGLPQRLLAEAREHGRVQSEGWSVRKDGTRFWADVVITPLRGNDGELRGFLKVTRDLTERREAEEHTRLSEQNLRMLLGSIKDYAIFTVDPNGCITSWNAGAERTKGYRAGEVMGHHISMFYPPIDVQRGKPQRMLEQARDQGRIEDEGWRVRKDGTQFWADVILTRIEDDGGNLVGFAKITRDLTERRRAEDQLRVRARQQASIAEVGLFALQTRDLQTLFDRTGTIVAQTLEMELVRLLERGSDGKLLVRSATGWPETVGRTLERPDDLLSEQGVRSGSQVPIESPGDDFVYGYLGVYSRDHHQLSADDAHFLQAVANVLSSAIMRRRMETQLRLAESKAEIERMRASRARDQVRERDDFLSVAAHELRTPLTALQLKLQSIETVWRKKPGEAIAAKFEARIEGALRQVERLTELVERLLDVSRIAQGRLVLTVENVDLVAIAREVMEDLGPQADQARSELRLVAPEALMGSWDRGRIQQALVNVVANAIKYGGGKPVDIRIEQKDSQVVIAIEDRGIGISEQDHERIFQRFERAAPLRHYGGLGLGLYITRHIIEAHGGRIWLHSTKGAGTTFTLELPLRSVPLQPSDHMGASNE